ncbi:PstS family phosphate ABC transporter substrate-binding protein [Bacillus rubiinfantis]|uniref:PstS family phosphate ABC transporter substrate-binding protein n=1 Tax=Bacillus rubiinfantis TaxID=1499680 RepID=UPI0005A6BF8C|nr:substrate-binding domain-containing protein [Bacillus rubiinfantis]
MGKWLRSLALWFGMIPFVLSIASVFTMNWLENYMVISSLIPLLLGGLLAGFFVVRKAEAADTKLQVVVYLFPLVYTAVLWAVFMLFSEGFYGADMWLFYSIFHIALGPLYFFAMFMGEGRLFLWAPLAYELAFTAGMLCAVMVKKIRPVWKPKQLVTFAVVFMLAVGTGSAVQWHRSKTVLPSYGFEYGGGYSSTDLTPYEVNNPDNKLPKLETKSSFTITKPTEMPILDGAEAAFPVYSAFANTVYENVNKVMESREVVSFTNTIYAYERLLSGEIDIYFGAEPSKDQHELAKKAGKELVMTPIGKEAFVFFVNPKNPVDGLQVSEIQGVYSGKIRNWSDLDGANKRIIAFQRPKNSGSQTLLEKIMGNTPIMEPMKEEVPEGMGGIIEQVADYRNYENSLGFSFRFFATGMNPNPNIKLLAINGVEPTPENIASNKYPFTANLYAITLKDNEKKSIQPFLKWMQGPQGQEIIGKIGYIPIKQ